MQIILSPEEVSHPQGLEIAVKGFKGDVASDVSSQVFIEVYEGKLRVHVWNGGEDPASSIEIKPI